MQTYHRTMTIENHHSISAVWAVPADFRGGKTDAIVLAHGAGNDMHHAFMSFFHEALARQGILSVKFNFLYMEQGRKAPDRTAKLEQTYRTVLRHVRQDANWQPGRLFIGGKSMGGRIASHLAAQGEAVSGLVCLGYPLHPAKKPDNLRSAHLAHITCPMLFLQGTRDPLCDLTHLRNALQPLHSPAQVYEIEGGDHSFKVPKRSGRTDEEIWQAAVQVILNWLRRTVR
jgi:predicted alpha/beta-hydrolase family hydrolase